ncbi:unnamed protein product [Ilex paraguariensis]|uniref:Uncharacterized protein n=1 Tax=Ilex paraguariensis TaxID=185542 RepID=A0ABC8S168_9AQUA
MASHFNVYARVATRATVLPPHRHKHQNPFSFFTIEPPDQSKSTERTKPRTIRSTRIRVLNGGDSYLDMWKKAVDWERKSIEFEEMAKNSAGTVGGDEEEETESPEVLERKSSEFQKILEVSTEERDRIQRMQVIDRAAAAIAAARALLTEELLPAKKVSGDSGSLGIEDGKVESGGDNEAQLGGMQNGSSFVSESGNVGNGTPGPNFWSWTPPPDSDMDDESNMKPTIKTSPSTLISPVMEKDRPADFLSIPYESKHFESNHNPPLPPLQSLMEVEKVEVSSSSPETPYLDEERELGVQFSAHAAEAAHALDKVNEVISHGVYPDGSRWWKETGIERRSDGVVCRWTLTRGVSADKAVEWEEKYWEASDEFIYKELGSEKSGRDAAGNVWHEFWRESISQNHGIVTLEKTADKWGKNGKGDEWQEKWWEHYDASGQAEKWAHKWCSIDPNTPVRVGHAHVWHERWGEKYDGQGGSMKYTDKWAERSEGDGWTKWGDKWDEHFDPQGRGVKQGETWWEGKYGERWNRTWGEGHNASGWVHKYGKSSSGEHWDTHEQQDTWYERFPHYGFYHCFDNSVQLREVKKPSEWS